MRDQTRIDALRVELNAKKEMLTNIEGGGAAPGNLFETRGWGIERRIARISAELHDLQADERFSHSRNAGAIYEHIDASAESRKAVVANA